MVLYIINIIFSPLKDGKNWTRLSARFCRILMVLMPRFKKRLIESWNVPDTYRDLIVLTLSRTSRRNIHLLYQRWSPCCYQSPQKSVHRKLFIFILPTNFERRNPSLTISVAVLAQSVEHVDCRAGGREFDSRGRTKTQGLKITEKWSHSLCSASGETFAWLGWPRKMAVPSSVWRRKIQRATRENTS